MRFPLMGKVVAVGLVVALLAAVLARISSLVDERSARQEEAVRSVQQSLAGAQTLLGPLLRRQCVEEWDSVTGEGREQHAVVERREFALQAVPALLNVDSTLKAEARYRGLFKVNGYTGHLSLQAEWPAQLLPAPVREHGGSRMSCLAPVVMLALGDVRGVRQASVQLDGQRAEVLPGTGHASYSQGLHVELPVRADLPVPADQLRSTPLRARIELDLVGTARLALVPAAGTMQWQLKSDWAHPSFGGRFLPVAREVRADGFDARWSVSSLASAAAADVLQGRPVCASTRAGGRAAAYAEADDDAAPVASGGRCLDTLDVAFIDPVNPYVLSDRATKYGMLFIALTFVALGLAEVLGRDRVRRVHPVQYGLVGLALSLFFLLLLSLSEHLPFIWAYAVASAACVALLGAYAAHMLGRCRDGAVFAAGMGLLYGLVYVLLQREQTALVIGSVGLFGAVAAVMWLTRRMDWYRLFEEARPPERQQARQTPAARD